MKRTSVVTWAIILFAITLPICAKAALPVGAHFSAGISCPSCHTANSLGPANLGSTSQTSPAYYNNTCQQCHRTGDANAGSKPFSPADASVAFGGHTTNAGTKRLQTSHRWDGSDINPAAGADKPILPALTSGRINTGGTFSNTNLRGRTGGQLACVRCHSMHIQNNTNGSVLRSPNDQDQMCFDCHRSRDTSDTSLYPDPKKAGSHPVKINYDQKAAASAGALKATIDNANPANPTSDLRNYLTQTAPSGNIVCSTCHGMHYTDSRSSTFDGASSARGRSNYANLSSGDGYILRTDRRGAKVSATQTFEGKDNLNLCTNCHANKKSHNAMDQDVQCTDCHGAHVAYDKDDPTNQKGTNVYLIRRDMSKAGIATKVYFRYTSGERKEYKNAQGTGVCQGCHNVPAPGGKYPPQHASNKASDCKGCHSHNSQAGSFSGACGKCHGNPPTTTTIGGPDGLASPATGVMPAGEAGVHFAHVTTRKMDCNACHNGYSDRAAMPSNTIDLGFAINAGTFPGFKGSITNGKFYTENSAKFSGGPITASDATNLNNTCAVYCHGSTLDKGYNSQPSWAQTENGYPAGTCYACHPINGNDQTMGSHYVHAGVNGQSCQTCHPGVSDNSHMQGSVQWDLSAVSGSAQYKPAGGVSANSGETGRVAPSATYGTCSNISCHGAKATNLPWGGSLWSTTETCAKCHSSQTSLLSSGTFYSTSYPTKVIINTDSAVGAHVAHVNPNSSINISAALVCNDCHSGATHMNGTADIVAWSSLASTNGANPSITGGVCSNVYCHGSNMPNGDATGTNRTPKWNVPFLGTAISAAACGTCHGFPPSSHGFTAPTTFPAAAAACNGCHPNVNAAATSYATIFVNKALHVDGKVDGGGGGSCAGCHGYPPAAVGFKGTQNNWSSARTENYLGGGGAHTVQGHISKLAKPSEGWANCTNCHNQNDHAPSPAVFSPSSNIKVGILPRVRFSNVAPQAKYSSNRLDGAAHVTGKCSNVACHFQKTPQW